jgi:putative aminopeptidase FrvX
MRQLSLLRELVEIESPTGDTAEIQARVEHELRAAGAGVWRVFLSEWRTARRTAQGRMT